MSTSPASSGLWWSPVVSRGLLWFPMVSRPVLWAPQVLRGLPWSLIVSRGLLWSPSWHPHGFELMTLSSSFTNVKLEDGTSGGPLEVSWVSFETSSGVLRTSWVSLGGFSDQREERQKKEVAHMKVGRCKFRSRKSKLEFQRHGLNCAIIKWFDSTFLPGTTKNFKII